MIKECNLLARTGRAYNARGLCRMALFGIFLILVVGCRSSYASKQRPVSLQAPLLSDQAHKQKVLIYSLVTRGWEVEDFNATEIKANFKGMRIAVTAGVGGQIYVRHRHSRFRKGHANNLKRWMGALQRTIRGVAVYDMKRLNDGLRAHGIDPKRIENIYGNDGASSSK